MRRIAFPVLVVLGLFPVFAIAGYSLDWELPFPHHAVLGVTAVKDTLMWVSSTGTIEGDTTNTILVYDIASLALVDSFVAPTQGPEAYYDLAYTADSNLVYCATAELDSLDVLDATTGGLVRRIACTGPEVCTDPSGVGCDGESLYVVSWSTKCIHKMALDGTNCHRVCSTPSMFPSGIGVDRTRGTLYFTSCRWPARTSIVAYDLPAFRLRDAWEPTEPKTLGGSDMWRDSCLLVVADMEPSFAGRVFCFSLTSNPADAAPTAIVAPDSVMWVDSLFPVVCVTNFGSAPIGDFPVYCRIDSAGTVVFDDTAYGEFTRPNERSNVEFEKVWHATDGVAYGVTFITALASDTNRANDTLRRTIVVGIGERSDMRPLGDWLFVSPNPFPASFRLQLRGRSEVALSAELYDVAGKRVDLANIPPGETSARLPTPGTALSPGTYFLRVSAEGRIATRRVVKAD